MHSFSEMLVTPTPAGTTAIIADASGTVARVPALAVAVGYNGARHIVLLDGLVRRGCVEYPSRYSALVAPDGPDGFFVVQGVEQGRSPRPGAGTSRLTAAELPGWIDCFSEFAKQASAEAERQRQAAIDADD